MDEMVAKTDCAKHQYCRGFTNFKDIDDMTDGIKKYGLILLAATARIVKGTPLLVDEDKRPTKLYVEKKEVLLKFFSDYLEFRDIDEDEMALVD